MNQKKIFLVLLGITAILSGCGDDPVVPENTDDRGSNTGYGTIEENYTDFTLKLDVADSPLGLLQGPFYLKGQNLRYDSDAMALVVDFTITNSGIEAHPEPVEVTFVHFVPDSVTVLNAPGEGWTFPFEFANDDGMWTPGEESLPLTVMFDVPYGVSIGFGAFISLGYGSVGGVIGGFVWHDFDADGIWDDSEPGLPDIEVILEGAPADSAGTGLEIRTVRTGPRGGFAFGGLMAGHYVVGVEPMDGREITTLSSLHVILVENRDGVGSFTGAAFGMRPLVGPVFVALPAAADAMIRSDLFSRQNDNYGADPFLGIGGTRTDDASIPADAIRSLIQFDLSEATRPVEEAWLELTIVGFWEGVGQEYRLDVYPVVPSGDRTPWVEGNGAEVASPPPDVDWVDPAYGVAWLGAEDGGDANNTTRPDIADSPAASALVIQGVHAPGDVVRFPVTDLVNSWILGETPNLGLMVRDGTATSGYFRQLMFGARDGLMREYSDSRVQPGPRLVIHFAQVDPN